MNERIKQVRKHAGLTQQAFADRLGLKQNTIAVIESGKQGTSNQVIVAICREFNVNEEWLRTGAGEMFREPDSFSLDQLVADRGGTELELRIIKAYFDLDPAIRRTVLDHFRAALRDPDDSVTSPTVEQLEEEYKKRVLNGVSTTGATASNITDGTEVSKDA